MKTYLKIMFPSQARGTIQMVVERLRILGFIPVTGEYDFEYSWIKYPKIDEIVALGNSIQKALKDTGIMFKLETVPKNKIVL